MSEADDLARRFFALWAEYLAALAADPQTVEPVRRWLALATGDGGVAASRSPADASAAAGASGKYGAALAQLARRVDELGERVAALERAAAGRGDGAPPAPAPRPRRRSRAARA